MITKEQIESLNWKHIDTEKYSNFITRGKKLYNTLIFKKKNIELLWIEELNQMYIGFIEDDHGLDVIFKGYCTSLNELKTIIKLLKI